MSALTFTLLPLVTCCTHATILVQWIDRGGKFMFASKGAHVTHSSIGEIMGGEPAWRTARRCDTGACVEIGALGKFVVVRSSADPEDTRILLSRDEWREFVAGVKDGKFDSL